jgi:hypothetical protein
MTLDEFVDRGIRISVDNGHHPTVFIGLRNKFGTRAAIQKLVESHDFQSGFEWSRKNNLLDWSLEAAVCRFPEHFTKKTRDYAAFRLDLARRAS